MKRKHWKMNFERDAILLVIGILMTGFGIWGVTNSNIEWGKRVLLFGIFLLGCGSLIIFAVLWEAFKNWYREKKSQTKGSQEGVVASHSTGLHRIDLTDEAVQTKNQHIPYSSIINCSFHRSDDIQKTACIIRYVDHQGRTRNAWLKGESFYSGLSIYTGIIRISEQHGYKLVQRPHTGLGNLARKLRKLGVESEFIYPDVTCNKIDIGFGGAASWHIDFGSLKLKHRNIAEIKITEDGQRIEDRVYDGYGGGRDTVSWKRQCHIDCIIQIEPVPDIACVGNPVKKFPRRVVDYHWEGGKIAQSLNEDAHLRDILTKAKAPVIEVKKNHIQTQGKKFPSLKLFQFIDIVAEHVRREASW